MTLRENQRCATAPMSIRPELTFWRLHCNDCKQPKIN